MRPTLAILVFATLAAGCDAENAQVPPSGRFGEFVQPSLEVSGAESDDPKTNIEAAFVNRSAEPIEILDVRTSCSCSIPREFSKRILKPGDQTLIPIQVTLPDYGTKQVAIQVITRPPSPEGRLMLTARGDDRAVPFCEHLPSVSDFVCSEGRDFDAQIDLLCAENSGDAPWVTGIEIVDSPKGWSAAVEPLLDGEAPPGRRRYTLKFHRDGDSPWKNSRENLQAKLLVSNSDVEPPPPFSLRVKSVRMLRAVPDSLSWNPGESMSRSVLLVFAKSAAWDLNLNSAIPKGLTCTISKLGSDKEFDRARLDFHLKTASPDFSECEIQVSAVAADKMGTFCTVPVRFTSH